MKPSSLFLLIPALSLMLSACSEPPADLANTKTHESGNIAFEHPGNWRVTDEAETADFHYLIVETPGDALVILQAYPEDALNELEAFAREFSSSATDETPIAEVGQSSFEKLPQADGYQLIEENFTVSMLGETLPHWRLYATKTIGGRQIFLIFQVALEDLEKARPGFEVIRKSLRARQ